MIDLQNITITYEDKEVLRDFSLRIGAGEKICISGKSGCGKSSVLMALLGFIRPSAGKISYQGVDLTAATVQSVRERVAFLSQDISFPQQTVRELIDAPFHFKANRHKRPSTARVLEVFASLHLDADIYDKKLSEISGGQKQRVLIALMLLLDKEILMLDEPTSALDPASVELVAQLLKTTKGKTVIAVSHDEQFALHFDQQIKLG